MKISSLLALSFLSLCAIAGCSDSNSSNRENTCLDYGCVVVPQEAGVQLSNVADIDISSRKLGLAVANNCDELRSRILDEAALIIANRIFTDYPVCGYYANGEWGEVWPCLMGRCGEYPYNYSVRAGEFTTSNTQEDDVDEIDTVKNDGQYMYAIRGDGYKDQKVYITKVWPASEMEEMAVINASDVTAAGNEKSAFATPEGLLLTNDHKLIVIDKIIRDLKEQRYSNHFSIGGGSHNNTGVRIFDVSNPKSPTLLHSYQIDGSMPYENNMSVRLINNRIFIVTESNSLIDWDTMAEIAENDIPGVPRFINPCVDPDFDQYSWSASEWDEWRALRDDFYDNSNEKIKKYSKNIRAYLETRYPTLDSLNMPKFSDGNEAKSALSCDNVYIPAMHSQDARLTIITELSGDNFDTYAASAVVTGNAWQLYASPKNLYLASNSIGLWWDQKNENRDGFTQLYRFGLGTQPGQLKYANSGEIQGSSFVLDNTYTPFNLSEDGNHLRIITSMDDSSLSNHPYNGYKLTVLDITASNEMKVIGSLDGIAKERQLNAVRLIGDKGYIFSDEEGAPLMVYDLSDPANVRKVSEIPVSGNASYIHPVGKNYLLTTGTYSGGDSGLKLDLYDISDPAHPNPKYTAKIADDKLLPDHQHRGYTDASKTPHAFQYHEGSGLLAIPLSFSNVQYADGIDFRELSNMLIFSVKPDSDFKYLGSIDHVDLLSNINNSNKSPVIARSRFYFKDKGVYDQDAVIYTVSDSGIKANDANKPDKMISKMGY